MQPINYNGNGPAYPHVNFQADHLAPQQIAVVNLMMMTLQNLAENNTLPIIQEEDDDWEIAKMNIKPR